jgi:pyrimidine-nucleoside phosphorylase
MSGHPEMLALIERKKAGEAMSPEELAWLCQGFVAGEIPDYQVAAWLMAVRWRGMSESETLALTRALVASGETLQWDTGSPIVDKHSTGGVGDKTSIALVPLLAAAGLTFVKMSGRGLGHTGGTIDKLESIPGFQVQLDSGRLRAQVARIGCALVGQSNTLVPADGVLYALRDVTATVDSLPLIASSVMSKKLAAGASAIVLDVKFGSGAFMRTQAEAEELGRAMVRIGSGAGRRVNALLSAMDQPLGKTVGNALEVVEAIEVLRNDGPADLRALTLELGKRLMILAGVCATPEKAHQSLERLLESGHGAAKLAELIEAQGGDAAVVDQPSRLPQAPVVQPIESSRAGWIAETDARLIAEAALQLGAGRRRKGDQVDPRVGVRLLAGVGDSVEKGQPIAEVHAASAADAARAEESLLPAYRWAAEPVSRPRPTHLLIED